MQQHKTHTTAQLLCLIITLSLVGASLPSCQSSTPTMTGGQSSATQVQSPVGGQPTNPEASNVTDEQPAQGKVSTATPAVLGFVLDPEGAPVPYAQVGDAIADINGAVSGELPGGTSGWIPIKSLGYATAFTRPGVPINGTAFFESRLTPFQAFLVVNPGEETKLEVGEAGQLQAGISIPADSVSPLPAILEATTYNLANLEPSYEPLDYGQEMDLAFAIAIEGSTDDGGAVEVSPGKAISIKISAEVNLPVETILAIFDPQAGVWQVQPSACVPESDGGLLCTVPRLSSHIGLFIPHIEASSPSSFLLHGLAAVRRLFRPIFASDDQAYQDALIDVQEWGRIMEGELSRTGSTSPEAQQEMSNRLGKLAEAAEAYAASHPGASAVSHLLQAADLATAFGELELAARLLKDAVTLVEKMADDLLKDPNCTRIREMTNVLQILILVGGSSEKVNAMTDKIATLAECDEWIGHVNVSLNLSGTNPGLEKYSRESGWPMWMEDHRVMMATNVKTYVLRGEDTVKLDFGEVKYGKYDRDNCHNYLTHGLESNGNIIMKFDGTYDGYTFSVGDLRSEGGSATVTYGAHAERYNDEKEECETYADQVIPAPNYTTLLQHGFSGSPPITIQEMLDKGGDLEITGGMKLNNEAYELGILPVESGYIRWYFRHTQRFLPVK